MIPSFITKLNLSLMSVERFGNTYYAWIWSKTEGFISRVGRSHSEAISNLLDRLSHSNA